MGFTDVLEKRTLEVLTLCIIAVAASGAVIASTGFFESSSNELVAEYRFDTGTGGTAYDTAGNNDGTITGANWTEGVNGKALEFDGDDDYVQGGDVLPEENFTISGWVTTDKIDDDDNSMGFVESSSSSEALIMYLATTHGSADNQMRLYAGGEEVLVGSDIRNTGWRHIVIARDGNNWSLYLDGSLDATGTNSASLDSTITIGNSYGGARPHNGRIDEVKIYSKGLNKSKIRSLYNSGSWRIGMDAEKSDSSKVLDMSFQHQNSTHVLDTSGHDNHGSILNGASQETAVGCKVGRCYSFDGVDDKVETSEINLSASDWTVMSWYYPEVSDNYGHIFTSSSSQKNFAAKVSKDLKPYFYSDDGRTYDHNAAEALSLREWQHLAYTYNGSSIRIYLDGQLVNEEAVSGLNIPSDKFVVQGGNEEYVEAKHDQLKVFNRSLSQQEIIEKTEGLSASGAVLDMRFDENGGDHVEDYSGNGNHGVLGPNESYGPKRVDGVSGKALEFDGIDSTSADEVTSDLVYKNMSSFTLSAWIKPNEINSWQNIVGSEKGNNLDAGMILEGKELVFHEYSTENTDRDIISSGPNIEVDQWQHVLATYDNGSLKLYKDGDLVDSGTYDLGGDNNNLIVGSAASNTYDRAFNGSIDEVKVYPYVVSGSKANQLYRQGISGLDSNSADNNDLKEGLVLHQSFDRVETCGQSDTVSCPSGMSGEIAVDESGESNHGELYGPAKRSSHRCLRGQCLEFDGNDDYVEINNTVLSSGRKELAVSAWIYITGNAGNSWERYVDLQDGSSNNHSTLYWDDDGSTYGFSALGADANVTGENPPKGRWMHWTGVVNETHAKFYLDGDLKSTAPISETTAESVVSIGKRYDKYDQAMAKIDEVRVYNRSISEKEIWKLYTRGRDRSSEDEMAGPEAWWRLDKGYRVQEDDAGENAGTWNSAGPASEKRYIVNEYHADVDLRVVSYGRSNTVTAGSCSQELGRGEVYTFSSSCYGVTDTVEGEKPFSAHFQAGGSDGPVPASFKGTKFVYEDCRDPEWFNVVAPEESASVTVSNSTQTVATASVSAGGHTEINTDVPTGSVYTITSDNPVLVTYDRNNLDTYMMRPASRELYGMMEDVLVAEDNTKVRMYNSEGSKIKDGTYSAYSNLGGEGSSQDGDVSVHAVANKSVLGGSRCADGDNGETDIGVSDNDLATDFYLPEPVEGAGDNTEDFYFTLTLAEAGRCTVYRSDGTKVMEKSTSNSPPYPGYMGFDTTNDLNLTAAGARVSCTSPAAMQWEPSNHEGEANLYGYRELPEGEIGKSIEFDGEDDYIDLDPFTLDSDSSTIMGRFYIEDFEPTENRSDEVMFVKQKGHTTHQFIGFGDGYLDFETNDNNNGGGSISSNRITSREWFHAALVFENGDGKLYVDGNYEGKVSLENNDLTASQLGYKMSSSSYQDSYPGWYDGKMDDVRIYPYALTQEQVKQVMNGGGVSVGN